MTEAPKRPRGRPPLAIPMTSAERSKARRMRGFKSLQIPPDVATDLQAIRKRWGDATDAHAVRRAVRAFLGRLMP